MLDPRRAATNPNFVATLLPRRHGIGRHSTVYYGQRWNSPDGVNYSKFWPNPSQVRDMPGEGLIAWNSVQIPLGTPTHTDVCDLES
jgi:hypothetical protein